MDRRTKGVILIGLLLAIAIPTVTAIVSQTVFVTIHPTAAISLTSDKTEYNNGETMIFTATLSDGMYDQPIVLKLASSGATVQSKNTVNGEAIFQVIAQNSGPVDINQGYYVEQAP